VLEGGEDRSRPVGLAEGLAPAEHLAGHRVQRVALHAHERAAQQVDPVEDGAARHRRPARAARPGGGPEAHRTRTTAELERHARAPGHAHEHGQVEVDDVPAGDRVRVDLAHASDQAGQQLALVGERLRSRGTRRPRRSEQQHLRHAAAMERDRQQPPRRGVGLDVERQHGQLGQPVRRAQHGIVEDGADTVARPRRSLDGERAPDAAVDQVARGEPHVGLVARDPPGDEPVA
jgi:hypothetical protein